MVCVSHHRLLQLMVFVADHFLFVVHKLYCVTYIQALVVLSCRLTQDERQAWCKKGLEVSVVVQLLLESQSVTDRHRPLL